jgi:hypothetical protein
MLDTFKKDVTMGPEMEARIMNIMIGFALGAIAAMLIGFKMAGWTTSKSAQAQVDEAVMGTRSAICAAQYLKQPDKARLEEFVRIEANDRADFIEKGGWDKMPGQEQASYGVARACVTGLEGMIKK